MRVWDIPVGCLCRNHLLAEHGELHAIWSIVLNDKRGYSRHPEVMRWRGRLKALWRRHEEQRIEMLRRGYAHRSPLYSRDIPRRHGCAVQRSHIESIESQWRKLRMKGCECITVKKSRK